MYVLIEEIKDWSDYIVTTSYKLLKASKDRGKIESYMKSNFKDETHNLEGYKVIYYIQEVDLIQ